MTRDNSNNNERPEETIVLPASETNDSLNETLVVERPFDANAIAESEYQNSLFVRTQVGSSDAQISKICRFFENNWTSDRAFSIRDALRHLPAELRRDAFKELVRIDIALGVANNSSVSIPKYKAEFPKWTKEVDEAYEDAMRNSAVRRQSRIGRKLGNLRIEGIIGKGGMGVVYKAYNETLRRYEAVKYLAPVFADDEKNLDFIKVELITNGQVDDPRFACAYNSGVDGDFSYLVMEYVDGVNLVNYLRNERGDRPKAGPISIEEAAKFVCEIAKGLDSIHRKGIIHRDIKPENIMIDEEGRIRILDLGLAKWRETESPFAGGSPSADENGAIVGTPAYMSPEGYSHPELVDEQSDIYSLGGVFFFLITGKLPIHRYNPHGGEPPRPLSEFLVAPNAASSTSKLKNTLSFGRPSSPFARDSKEGRLLRVLEKALEPERSKRYKKAQNVVDDIEEILGEEEFDDVYEERRTETARDRARSAVVAFFVAITFTAAAYFVVGLFRSKPGVSPPVEEPMQTVETSPVAEKESEKAPDEPIRITSDESMFRIEPSSSGGWMISGLKSDRKFDGETLVIPGYIDDKPILSIRQAAFPSMPFRRVVISEGVQVVGSNAFPNNAKLEEVVLPESLVEIQSAAFWGCSSIKKINLPSRLEVVGAKAFIEASSSGSLALPDSLVTIGEGAFASVDGITAFEASPNLRNYRVIDGVLFTADGKTLLAYPTCKSGASYVLPDETRTIAAGAFAGAKFLESITIHDKCETIETNAFARCEKLAKFVVDGNPRFSVADGLLYANGGKALLAYPSGRDEETVVLPEGVEVVCFGAFSGSKIKTVKLPSTLRVIDHEAFRFCGRLAEISIPEGVTRVASRAFGNCDSLQEISTPRSLQALGLAAFEHDKSLEKVTIAPNSIKLIDQYMFYDCPALRTVELGEGIEAIGPYAFSNCESLEPIDMPKSVRYVHPNAYAEWAEK